MADATETALITHRNALAPLVDALRDLYEWCDDVHQATDSFFCDACAQPWPCAPERARLLLVRVMTASTPNPETRDE